MLPKTWKGFRAFVTLGLLPYLWSKLQKGTIEEVVGEFNLEETDHQAEPLTHAMMNGVAHIVTFLEIEEEYQKE